MLLAFREHFSRYFLFTLTTSNKSTMSPRATLYILKRLRRSKPERSPADSSFETYSPTEVRENPDGDDAVYCGRSPSRREQTGPRARLARFVYRNCRRASRRQVGWRQSSPPSSPESSELSSLLSSAVSLESSSADSSWVRSSSTVASSLSSEVSISVDSAETYSS